MQNIANKKDELCEMRYLALTLLLLFSLPSAAQTINESLKSVREKYNPLFGNKSSSLAIDFVRKYELGTEDYEYFLIVKVNSESLEKESVSLGYSIFGSGLLSGSSVSAGAQYDVKRADGEVILNKDQLIQLYECGNNVYKHINKAVSIENVPETLAYCETKGVTLGSEIHYTATNGKTIKFYFKVGGESIFEMSKKEFEDIMAVLGWVKRYWPE